MLQFDLRSEPKLSKLTASEAPLIPSRSRRSEIERLLGVEPKETEFGDILLEFSRSNLI